MRRALLLAAVLPLTSCAGGVPINACRYAEVRRTLYTTAIRAADAYVLSGRPLPSELELGREAAATALAILNRNCPVAPAA